MRKETLEKKLNKLKEKLKAYEDINDYLYGLLADKEKSIDYKEVVDGVLKSVTNMKNMVWISIETTRQRLEEAS